jgi:hypothetical protein
MRVNRKAGLGGWGLGREGQKVGIILRTTRLDLPRDLVGERTM